MGDQSYSYRAGRPSERIIQPLDAMTLVYHRPSGVTHIVAEPVPEILAAMGEDVCDAALIAARLATQYDLGNAQAAKAVIAARLEELAALGLLERSGA